MCCCEQQMCTGCQDIGGSAPDCSHCWQPVANVIDGDLSQATPFSATKGQHILPRQTMTQLLCSICHGLFTGTAAMQ
jgi:hypothetical protein